MVRVHFVGKLESVHHDLIHMGELTLESIAHSLDCLLRTEGATYERATELESNVDDWSRTIRDQAVEILVLQSPVAGDARLITGVLESVIDLEQIADYTHEISDLAFQTDRCPTSQLLSQVVGTGERVGDMLANALDSWRRLDRALGLSVQTAEASIRDYCRAVTERLYELISARADAQIYVNLILICKHFERMARLIVNIAEQAVSAAPAER